MNGDGSETTVNRRANVHEIARKCGVHVSTVSSVLAGKSKQRRISAEVTEKVIAVAAELDYSPNLLFRSVLQRKTDNIAFFNGFRLHQRSDVYMDALRVAIERSAGERGYDVTMCCDFSRSAADTYRHLNGGRNDGVIFFAAVDGDPLLEHLRKSRMPLVLLNSVDSHQILSSVDVDQKQGITLIAEHLVALGHRRIAMVGVRENIFDCALRVRLLRDALRSMGVEVPDRWVLDNIRKDRTEILREPEPPTAVFCWQDKLGYEFLNECHDAGIRVPEDVSVVGFDGIAWPSKTGHKLASARVDLDRLGVTAVETLDALISGTETGPIIQAMPASFDPGTTLAPPAR